MTVGYRYKFDQKVKPSELGNPQPHTPSLRVTNSPRTNCRADPKHSNEERHGGENTTQVGQHVHTIQIISIAGRERKILKNCRWYNLCTEDA